MNKSLREFEKGVIEAQERERASVLKTSKTWAETAPVPEDPNTCQWCRGLVIVLQDSKQTRHCQTLGCAQDAIFTRWCSVCRRNFDTGNSKADICWECDAREDAEIKASMGPISEHGPANVGRGSRNRRA